MCQNESFRSDAPRGMNAKLIGFDWNACRVRRCVVSPAANEWLSKCAPMCSELGGEKALRPSSGVRYEQLPTHPVCPLAANPPGSVLGQLVALGGQWKCQSIGKSGSRMHAAFPSAGVLYPPQAIPVRASSPGVTLPWM